MFITMLTFFLTICFIVPQVLADVPGLMSFQGTLTDSSGVALDTTVSMTFSIYTDSVGGNLLWNETRSSVVVGKGTFNVILGGTNAVSDTVFRGSSRWLGIQVGGDPEIQPRQRIVTSGYAFQAAKAETADVTRLALTEDDGDWTIGGDDVYRQNGNVGIGITGPAAKLDVQGTLRVGLDTVGYAVSCHGDSSGSGLFWDSSKMSLRVGRDQDGSHWLPDSIGLYSFAAGLNTVASGTYSTSLCGYNTASGEYSIAMGLGTVASGRASTSMGIYTKASGLYSTAMGWEAWANGKAATALGQSTSALGNRSVALGGWTKADGLSGFATGYFTQASGTRSTAMGYGSIASGVVTFAIGYLPSATGDYSTAIGKYVTAANTNTIVLGKGISVDANLVNDIQNSLMVGFEDTTATLFVGGEEHRVGIRTEQPTAQLDIHGPTGYDQLRVRSAYTPLSTADINGHVGDVAWDENFIYIKTVSGWKRTTLEIF